MMSRKKKGAVSWYVQDYQIVKVRYDREVDHGGHGSGYQEDFYIFPDGVSRHIFGSTFETEALAEECLLGRVNSRLNELTKQQRDIEAEVKSLKLIQNYLKENCAD
jgi:hypothetical protein